MAVWALGRLLPKNEVVQIHAQHFARESDSDVLSEWAQICLP
jgi:hypothetical protein